MTDSREKTDQARNAAFRQAAGSVAVIAAVFTLLLAGLLIYNSREMRPYALNRAAEVTQSERAVRSLQEMKARVEKEPKNERLKEDIRLLDARIRWEYSRHEGFMRDGFLGLFIALGVLLLALKGFSHFSAKLPNPLAFQSVPRFSGRARMALAFVGFAVAVGLGYAATRAGGPARFSALPPAPKPAPVGVKPTPETPKPKPAPATGTPKPVPPPVLPTIPTPIIPPAILKYHGDAVAIDFPSSEQISRNWPVFRGPGGLGLARGEYPRQWDGAKGTGVAWKTAVPLPGNSSPVVWGDYIFLTGADEKQRAVYCFEAQSGKLRWQRLLPNVPGASAEPPKIMDDTGYAAPTMAVDGKRVFAMFASGDVAAFDFDGKPLWVRNLGLPNNMYGHAASLALYRNRLIIQFDQGGAAEDQLSALYALNIANGETIWQTTRPVPNSWSTPIVISTGDRDEIITCANPWVIAYDPFKGGELWRVDCLSGDVAPSPVFASGKVIACSIYSHMAAIRPGGTGDVTKTQVAWISEENLPDSVSPLATCDLIFLVTPGGLLTCVDLANGKKLWEHQFEAGFYASPTLVGQTIFLPDTKGVTHIFEAGKAFKLIGTAALGEDVFASPAFVNGRIYMRGKKNLYCIGAKP